MDSARVKFEERREKASRLYASHPTIHNPYLDCDVVLNAEGFHHLEYSSHGKRTKREQLVRFRLLSFAIEVIRRSGTLQEYRRKLQPIGRPSARGETRLVPVEYWAFVAIVGRPEAPFTICTVLRRVGDGDVTFRSVMPVTKIRRGKQHLSMEAIEDD